MNKLLLLVPFILVACQSREDITRQQYVVEGMNLYATHCANCHQINGSGLKDLYPALAKTDVWQRINANQMTCIIKVGQKDSIRVNGKKYQAYMPGNATLQALDIAEIVTYLRDEWGPEKSLYSLDSARLALKNCQ